MDQQTDIKRKQIQSLPSRDRNNTKHTHQQWQQKLDAIFLTVDRVEPQISAWSRCVEFSKLFYMLMDFKQKV